MTRRGEGVVGVYMLFKAQELVYVGRSNNCAGRIKEHLDAGREFDYAAISPLPQTISVWVEAAIIRATQAAGNKTHTDRHSIARTVASNIAQAEHMSGESVEVATPPRGRVVPADDPLDFMSFAEAQRTVGRCRLSGDFRAAFARGELNFLQRGRAKYIRSSELRAWCEDQIAAAKAA